MAVLAMTQRITDAGSDVVVRNQRIAMAWNLGASAQELHDACGLSGAELKAVLVAEGADPARRRRGWRHRRKHQHR